MSNQARIIVRVTAVLVAFGVGRLRAAPVPTSGPAVTTPKVLAVLRDTKLDESMKTQALEPFGLDVIVPLCDQMRDPRYTSVAVGAIYNNLHLTTQKPDPKQYAAIKSQLPTLLRVIDTTPTTQGPGAENARHGALGVLLWLGKDAAPALPTVNKILASDNSRLHYDAFSVLEEIGAPALPTISKLLNHPRVGRRAMASLSRSG